MSECLEEGFWICRAVDFPVKRERSYKIPMDIIGLYSEAEIHKQKHSIITYIEPDSLTEQIGPGDILIAYMKPVRPGKYGNPEEFNYREYLYRKRIFYQVFIKSGSWQIIKKCNKELRYFPVQARQAFVNRLLKITGGGEETGIITALATGSKDYLEEEIRTSYSEAGAMHVLAVSGLHAGLVWYVLNLIFYRLKTGRLTRFLYYILMIGLLWVYVILTGMSASVTRAGIMLTIVIMTGISGHGSVSYNPVFLSAFLLLLIKPGFLFDVGFQFSYMAVLGILFFHPRIKKLYVTGNRIPGYVFELISVSISAQAGTFLLSIFYFNKFPLYFLLTNLIVIPLVTLILVMIILSLFFWCIDPVFHLMIRAESFLTLLMNKGVKSIESLPLSCIHDIYIDRVELIILLTAYVLFHLFIVNKQVASLKCIVVALTVFLLYGGFRSRFNKRMPFFVLFNIPGVLALDLVDNDLHYLVTKNLTKEKEDLIIRNCGKFWLKQNLRQPLYIDLDGGNVSCEGLTSISFMNNAYSILVFQQWCIVIIHDFLKAENGHPGIEISLDQVVINSGGFMKLPAWINISGTGCIAVSSGIKGKLYDSGFRNEMIEGIRFIDVKTEGAVQEFFSDMSPAYGSSRKKSLPEKSCY